MIEIPTLPSARLVLRKPMEKDAIDQLELFRDPEVMRFHGEEPYQSLQEVKDEINAFVELAETEEGMIWMIILKETDQCIGDIGFFKWDKANFRCEIGFKLKRDCWGKGLMSEAVTTILDFLFNELNLNRVEGLVDPNNLPSQKLLRRLGFQMEGVLRDYEFEKGRFGDLQMNSLLKREWNK
ncbi:hypothetical protein NEF87_003147 [Candidatus Lokiarchaeum ossiferum]|uniref:N-acetyltransferase domain-containing protein n=1 Tax=Candidatus Lokiarchaeum ossiferum TaxID=2951803 RepID=A0ABY6HTL0_9ARCH|nr:hypothetical protein NEF87_003147 [Candidatus Lokiarchaeum sp. B-35]